jgi:hypothetical protein
MMTTAEKRRAKLDRAALLSLRAALCPSSGRERLGLNCVQRHLRQGLERGFLIREQYRSGKIEAKPVGKLRPDECRAVQPSSPEPKYGLLWADLTPHQRRALRKYRAGKKKERELALALRQMKSEGCKDEATRNLNQAIKLGDAQAASYWRKRLDRLAH